MPPNTLTSCKTSSGGMEFRSLIDRFDVGGFGARFVAFFKVAFGDGAISVSGDIAELQEAIKKLSRVKIIETVCAFIYYSLISRDFYGEDNRNLYLLFITDRLAEILIRLPES